MAGCRVSLAGFAEVAGFMDLQGTAEVVFTRKPDAVAAVKRYNNVQLDGKPMKIEMIGTNLNSAPVPAARSNGGMTIMAGRGRTVSAQS